MTPSAQTQSLSLLLETFLQSTKPSDQVMHFFFKERRYMGSSDRQVIRDHFFSLLKKYLFLEKLVTTAFGNLSLPMKARRIVLAYHALRGDGITKLFSGEKYAPDVLNTEETLFCKNRDVLIKQVKTPALQANLPQWLFDELEKMPDFEPLFETFSKQAPVDLRVNTLKTSQEQTLELLKGKVEKTPYSPVGLRLVKSENISQLEAYQNGLIEIQDEGSQLLALFLNPSPKEKIMDYCAGAGGKTLFMAALMNNTGSITACDTAIWRLNRMKERLKRACIFTVQAKPIDDSTTSWFKRHKDHFDKVLVDAPCSGTGTLRRHPELVLRLTPDEIQELCQKQQDILQKASSYVKVGGTLVYATCSLLEKENECQVDLFLKNNPSFVLHTDESVMDMLKSPYLKLRPDYHQTDGFFAVRLKRIH